MLFSHVEPTDAHAAAQVAPRAPFIQYIGGIGVIRFVSVASTAISSSDFTGGIILLSSYDESRLKKGALPLAAPLARKLARGCRVSPPASDGDEPGGGVHDCACRKSTTPGGRELMTRSLLATAWWPPSSDCMAIAPPQPTSGTVSPMPTSSMLIRRSAGRRPRRTSLKAVPLKSGVLLLDIRHMYYGVFKLTTSVCRPPWSASASYGRPRTPA